MGPKAAAVLPDLRQLVKAKPRNAYEARISSAALKLATQIESDAAANVRIP